MTDRAVRSTLALEPELDQALRLKTASTHRSMSELVNDAIRAALREDREELAAFGERTDEESISDEDVLARLPALPANGMSPGSTI